MTLPVSPNQIKLSEIALEFPEPAFITATGGTITTSGDYKIHTFTSSGTFTVTAVGNAAGSNTIEYLIAAGGGGGGGDYYAAGGGAGGALTSSAYSVSATGYTITIGGGGAGGTTSTAGSNGGNTTAFSQTGIGGGRGGTDSSNNGANGGCGGGGVWPAGSGGTGSQGFDGGNPANEYRSGGGGGMGSAGISISGTGQISGGSGLSTTIRGSTEYYCAGGCGWTWITSGTWQDRASGIGGRAAISTNVSGYITSNLTFLDAVANTGSGGGGHDQRSSGYTRAGNGSGGIVIIRYKYQ
jgi:hypothetical protein